MMSGMYVLTGSNSILTKDVRPDLHGDRQVLSRKLSVPFLHTLQTAPDEMTLCNVSRLQRRYPLGITTGHLGEDTGGVTDVDTDFALDEEDDIEDNFADDALEDWLTL